MAKILNLIVSDIFGKTDALQRLADDLPRDTRILDPYGGKALPFNDESHAYATFNQLMGPDKYLDLLREEIRVIEGEFQLVGFSAGATACWRTACQAENLNLRQAICIYGSQIRHHTLLEPQVPTTVLLPSQEDAFDVKAHGEILNKIPQTTVKHTPYLHGFMNELSPNFDRKGLDESLEWLKAALQVKT